MLASPIGDRRQTLPLELWQAEVQAEVQTEEAELQAEIQTEVEAAVQAEVFSPVPELAAWS